MFDTAEDDECKVIDESGACDVEYAACQNVGGTCTWKPSIPEYCQGIPMTTTPTTTTATPSTSVLRSTRPTTTPWYD